jgi:transposase-like protein
MTNTKDKPAAAAIKDLLNCNPDGLREIVRAVMQEMLEVEVTDALQAGKGERDWKPPQSHWKCTD